MSEGNLEFLPDGSRRPEWLDQWAESGLFSQRNTAAYAKRLEAALMKVTKALEKHDAGNGCSRATLGDMAVLVEAFDLIANIPAPQKESR